mgnify:CR=1 FL=1
MAELPYPDSAEERAERWAATMTGHGSDDVVVAHADSSATVGDAVVRTRPAREDNEAVTLATNATRSHGAGHRVIDEAPDPFRTCFERDRDRILHDSSFRRLAGKTQVFVFPDDHQRTRMTHALEVAQVARSIAEALSLNVPLVEAMAIGHDCGHGPGGHASEDALSPYLDGGFDHAPWGADVTLAPLNLCAETLDGIRNHSWSLPAPRTPEGEVVSWADRIAYVCHDFEDAAAAGRSHAAAAGACPPGRRTAAGDHRAAGGTAARVARRPQRARAGAHRDRLRRDDAQRRCACDRCARPRARCMPDALRPPTFSKSGRCARPLSTRWPG